MHPFPKPYAVSFMLPITIMNTFTSSTACSYEQFYLSIRHFHQHTPLQVQAVNMAPHYILVTAFQ